MSRPRNWYSLWRLGTVGASLASYMMVHFWVCIFKMAVSVQFWYTPTEISLATLDGQIADPEIAVKFEMRDTFKVHGTQT